MRYQFTPSRLAVINKKKIASVGKDVEKLETSHIAGRNGAVSV